MVMAYIIFVNPAILGFAGIPALQGQGPGFAATQAATCLVAGVMTILMGLVANYPLALASGMGLNAAVAFQLVAGLKLPWPAAMGGIALPTPLDMIVIASADGRALPLPGQAMMPKSLVAWPDLSSLGAGPDFPVFVRVGAITAVVTIFSVMLSDFFHPMGTVVGIGT